MFKTVSTKTRNFDNDKVTVTRMTEAVLKPLKNAKGEEYFALSYKAKFGDGTVAEFCEYRRFDNKEAAEAKVKAFNKASEIEVELEVGKQSICEDEKGRQAKFTTFWGHGLTKGYVTSDKQPEVMKF